MIDPRRVTTDALTRVSILLGRLHLGTLHDAKDGEATTRVGFVVAHGADAGEKIPHVAFLFTFAEVPETLPHQHTHLEGGSGVHDGAPIFIVWPKGGDHGDNGGVDAHRVDSVFGFDAQAVAYHISPWNRVGREAHDRLVGLPLEHGGDDPAGFTGVGVASDEVNAGAGQDEVYEIVRQTLPPCEVSRVESHVPTRSQRLMAVTPAKGNPLTVTQSGGEVKVNKFQQFSNNLQIRLDRIFRVGYIPNIISNKWRIR